MEKFDNSICFHCQSLGLSFSSVGRAMRSWSRGPWFKSQTGTWYIWQRKSVANVRAGTSSEKRWLIMWCIDWVNGVVSSIRGNSTGQLSRYDAARHGVCLCLCEPYEWMVDKACRRLRLRRQLKILPIPTGVFGLRVPHGSLLWIYNDLKYRSAP